MSYTKEGAKCTANSSSMAKGISGDSGEKVDQLSHRVEDISLDSPQDGGWEVYARKAKPRTGSNASRSSASHGYSPKPWGHPDVQKLGMWNSGSEKGPGHNRPTPNTDSGRPVRPQSSSASLTAGQPVIPPPLQQGWNWRARAAASQPPEEGPSKKDNHLDAHGGDSDDDRIEDNVGDSDAMEDTDDDLLSDEFDSDDSQKSHETRKKSKWFRSFFEILDKLSVDEINEPARQWHCPACQGGPGAIDWYRGLQPLMTHAKTKGSVRMKVHREFAELLDEELRRRGTSVVPAGEAFGKWKGLSESVNDHDIVWPPMVMIMNTRLTLDDNEKWTGMGNQELLDYFSSYAAVKARHSYGPQGHRGISVLIFESSAMGYLEAERLHNHFSEEGTDRDAWERHKVSFRPGGQRQLYGYMAEKRDLDGFNQHSQGKSKLKFEIRSYQEMVVDQMKQISEDNQQLIWFKNKAVKERRHSKALEESFGIVSEKLRRTLDENRIVKQRSKMHHEQNKEEMDSLEQFFKERLKFIREARYAKEDNFEMIQQEEREKVKQSNANLSSSRGDPRRRVDEVAKFIKLQDKEMEEFVAERERLIKVHEEERITMKKRQLEEEVELEKKFDAELNKLMEKYIPN